MKSVKAFFDRAPPAFGFRPRDFVWCLAVVAAGIGFHYAGIDGKASPLTKPGAMQAATPRGRARDSSQTTGTAAHVAIARTKCG